MITLLTGTPGAGKTAWTVQELTRLPSQRKIYIHGIPELKVAHEPIFCTSDLCDHCRSFDLEKMEEQGQLIHFVEDWPSWATDGSLIVVDEVQRIWRPTNSASGLPEEIAALETHRHRGLDFWLISQGPHLFHSNIRLLIGRHIHLVATWRGRTEYEFPECRQNVASRSDAVIRPYTLPKQVFKLYKSASLHTKLSKRKPLSFYILILCACIIAFISYRVYNRIHEFTEPSKIVNNETTPTAGETPQTATLGAGGGGAPASITYSSVDDFKPVEPGRPETAPAYAHLLKVKAVPLLAGCIATKTSCKCYTTQATPYPVTWEQCKEHMLNLHFNPYLDPPGTTNTPPTPQNQIPSLTKNLDKPPIFAGGDTTPPHDEL